MSADQDLSEVVADVAASLPADQVELAAKAISQLPGPTPGLRDGLGSLVPTVPFQAAIRKLVDSWAEAPSRVDGAALSLALRSACAAAGGAGGERSRVEVVWTGPEGAIGVRLTHAVLLDVISSARSRLTLVSFAAHHVPEVAEALRAVAGRGVDVRVVVDGGTGSARAFAAGGRVALYTWPPTLLPDGEPNHASLHAKAAVADQDVAFVTSANLTAYALERNIELGLLVRGGEVPRLLAEHFSCLIGAGELIPWKP